MSEKWETVKTESKRSGGAKNKNGVANGKPLSKKQEAKVYTMEDVLPASSVENMYASAFNPTPASPKKEQNGAAKPVAQKPKSTEKKVEKPRLPANLQEAVKMNVRVEDLKNLVESSQTRFPDSPLLWLRDVAAYLNIKMVTDPPVGETELVSGLPSTALTANMRKVINVMLQNCTESMKETIFETCVSNTAHDLAKGLCVTGWRVLIQMLAEVNPSLVAAHIPRYIELRNSYANRPAIGLAILWSVGQAGLKSLHTGIRVWLEIMLPVMTMRHYSKYVVDYLASLLSTHNITTNTNLNKPVMDIQNFLTVQDSVFVLSNQMNKEHAKKLKDIYPSLRTIAVAGCKNHELFPALMARLTNLTMPDQVVDTLDLLAICLTASPAAVVHWHKSYISNLGESGQLLQYLDTHWSRFKSALDVPEFQDTIEAFSDYNESVSNKEGLLLATEGCDSLSERFSGPAMAWFPWKTLSFFLLVSTAALINLDVERSGGQFSKSNTGQFLTDIGQYDNVFTSYLWCLQTGQSTKLWADTNLPVYYNQINEASGPYLQMANERLAEAGTMLNLGLTKMGQLYDSGLDWLEGVMPGVKVQVASLWSHLQKFYFLALARGQEVVSLLVVKFNHLISGEIDWAESFNNLRKQMMSALNFVQVQMNQLVK